MMFPVIRALSTVYSEEMAAKEGTFYSPALRVLAGARILLFPDTISQFKTMNLMGKLDHPSQKHDPLYFLAHNYYMSRQFNVRQRVEVAMQHHEYEAQTYNCEYSGQVYRSRGVPLWEQSFDDQHFSLVLAASRDNRHEGDLTVILSVNDATLCRMSFCYLNASIFGLPPQMTMLISRNQTDRTSCRTVFDRWFKQNSPQLFCLSALCGIALANEFKVMFAIRHDSQIAYEEPLDTGFRNSYTALWEKFDAVEIDRHVFKLNVPLTLRPVELVDPSHRRRARARRRYWDEIVQSARASVLQYRRPSHADPTFAANSCGEASFTDVQFNSDRSLFVSPPRSGLGNTPVGT
jgi:uncharacterized protein VirK/YbjX